MNACDAAWSRMGANALTVRLLCEYSTREPALSTEIDPPSNESAACG